jgi:uncharacterized protein YqiB (DUF1249 family)
VTTLKLESNKVAYLSRLLEERYHHLQALIAHAHLDDEHLQETLVEKKVIEEIQLELVPH